VPEATTGVTILNTLSAGIRNFTGWVGAHPAYAESMDKTLLGLGAALTVLGTAATIGAIASLVGSGGTIALVAVGLGALAGAFHELPGAIKEAETLWKAFPAFLSANLSEFLKTLGMPFQPLADEFKTAAGWIDSLTKSLTGLAHPIQDLERLLGLSGTLPGLNIHGTSGLHVPATAQVAPPLPLPQTRHGPDGRIMRGGYGQHAEADIPADNAVIAAWIRTGAPMTVTNVADVKVQNTGDIARGANAFSSRQSQRPNTGASGVNLRATPSGSAALAMPGFG
jgi:hypothetical protein